MAGLSAVMTHYHPEGIKGVQGTTAAIRMARNGKLENVELSAVLVVGAQGLKIFRIHAEHEVISEDRVIVLEDGSHLTL